MAQRTVRPELVKGLQEWAKRWGSVTNLGFDPETREPTVYAADSARARVKTFPWVREGDTMTILTQPSRFTEGAREAARDRFQRIQEQRTQFMISGEQQLRVAEANLLTAWRVYNAAPVAVRGTLRRDILAAERAVREIEEAMAKQLYPERVKQEIDDYVTVYNPPMPTRRRGIPLVAVGKSEAASALEKAVDAVVSAATGGGGAATAAGTA